MIVEARTGERHAMRTMMTVAVVDDDPIVCSSLTTILEATKTAAVVWTAQDGQTAVAKYAKHSPDILLIDVQMPIMDGLQAARLIIEQQPEARILFLTTFADQAYIDDALALGARGYLIKQDISSVAPALHAVMSGQIVLGAEVLERITAKSQAHADSKGVASSSAYANPESNAYTLLPGELDARELALSALVAQGLDNRDIAGHLHLSEGTVRNKITRILDKTGFTNRTQLAIAYIHAGGQNTDL